MGKISRADHVNNKEVLQRDMEEYSTCNRKKERKKEI